MPSSPLLKDHINQLEKLKIFLSEPDMIEEHIKNNLKTVDETALERMHAENL